MEKQKRFERYDRLKVLESVRVSGRFLHHRGFYTPSGGAGLLSENLLPVQ